MAQAGAAAAARPGSLRISADDGEPSKGLSSARVRANAGRIEHVDPTRRLVGEFVGQAFYGVLMKQVQESRLKTEYLHGGRAEEAFASQLGMELAARIGRSANDPVAERIHRSFQKHQRAAERMPPREMGDARPAGQEEARS